MDNKSTYDYIMEELKQGRYLSTPRNNKLLLEFIKAKFNGAYCRLVFPNRINSFLTAIKKARNLKKIDEYFHKDFDMLSEAEVLGLRDAMNDNKIYCSKTLVKWKTITINGKQVNKSYFEIVPTTRPLEYRSKMDYKDNFSEFFRFVIEYHYQENKKDIENKNIEELKDVTRYFTIQKPEDFVPIKVDFIPDDELFTLLKNIRNRKFKHFVQLSLMSGSRPCEGNKIRYGPGYNLYKNKEGKWIIHLPKIKRVSYAKFPIVVDMYEDDLYPYFEMLSKELKPGDYVFDLTDATIRKLMRHYTTKYLGKTYSPKVLRKTARMIRTNANYSHDWINKLMGHAPGSKVQGHYTNYEGIKNDNEANDRLKGQQYPSLMRDYEQLKMQFKAQQEQILSLAKQFMALNNERKEDILEAISLKKAHKTTHNSVGK